ncbi:Axin-1 [Chionoecetes opilio]|uniref:Axin-1 n=1 Tax=Chionoecetes opilio TaxID=41210 RepID=A0A8J4XQD5_CHIOP|nr:Axin-1 [Chionoecetes opilio]
MTACCQEGWTAAAASRVGRSQITGGDVQVPGTVPDPHCRGSGGQGIDGGGAGEPVTSWLLDSDKFCGSLSSGSVHAEAEWNPRLPSSRSTHTSASATSPGTIRCRDITAHEGLEWDITAHEGLEWDITAHEGLEWDITAHEGLEWDITAHEGLEWDITAHEGLEWDITAHEGLEWDITAHEGLEWDITAHEGLEWDITAHEGLEWDITAHEGLEWDITAREGLEWDITAHEGLEWDITAHEGLEWDITAHEGLEWDITAHEGLEWDITAREGRSGSSGGRRSGSGMSVGGIATNGSNNSGSGSVVGGGRTGSQERGAWVGVDTGMHLTHGHSFHLPQGSLQPHLPHQDDSKRRSRGGGSHGSGRSGGHSSSHSSGHSRGQSETGSGRTVAHGDTLSTAATSANSGSNGSTLRRARPPRHTQSTPTGMACESGGGSGAGSGSNQLGPGAGASSNGSFPTTNAPEVTTIVYNFHDDAVPFVTRVPTFPVTLKRFKQHLPKKGNYRFFFKKHCEEFGLINEEITEDSVNLPLFEGKIFAQIRKAD